MALRDVDDAVIEEPVGALIRITSGAICGTDLQTHDGRARAGPGLVLGHEPLGMVEATGGCCSPTRPCWKGTWEVDMADRVPERLDRAGELGAVRVDCSAGDPVEQVRDLRARAGLPLGMKMGRADRGTDAGFQAADREHRGQERPSQVISGRARLAGPTRRLRIAGVTRNVVSIRPRMAMWTVTAGRVGPPCSRRVRVGFGRTWDRRYTVRLRKMIVPGWARPRADRHSPRVSPRRARPRGQFGQRAGGVINALLTPP